MKEEEVNWCEAELNRLAELAIHHDFCKGITKGILINTFENEPKDKYPLKLLVTDNTSNINTIKPKDEIKFDADFNVVFNDGTEKTIEECSIKEMDEIADIVRKKKYKMS